MEYFIYYKALVKMLKLSLLKQLILINKGTGVVKLKATFILSLYASPVAFFAEKINDWWMLNYAYVSFVMIAVVFDYILGFWVHAFIKRDFSIEKNIIGVFKKAFLAVAIGVLVEGFNHIGETNIAIDVFVFIGRLMVFIYPAGSAAMNSNIITNGLFPPISFIKKMKLFNKDLNLDSFKDKNNYEEPVDR